jgi:hypothetical protein
MVPDRSRRTRSAAANAITGVVYFLLGSGFRGGSGGRDDWGGLEGRGCREGWDSRAGMSFSFKENKRPSRRVGFLAVADW